MLRAKKGRPSFPMLRDRAPAFGKTRPEPCPSAEGRPTRRHSTMRDEWKELVKDNCNEGNLRDGGVIRGLKNAGRRVIRGLKNAGRRGLCRDEGNLEDKGKLQGKAEMLGLKELRNGREKQRLREIAGQRGNWAGKVLRMSFIMSKFVPQCTTVGAPCATQHENSRIDGPEEAADSAGKMDLDDQMIK